MGWVPVPRLIEEKHPVSDQWAECGKQDIRVVWRIRPFSRASCACDSIVFVNYCNYFFVALNDSLLLVCVSGFARAGVRTHRDIRRGKTKCPLSDPHQPLPSSFLDPPPLSSLSLRSDPPRLPSLRPVPILPRFRR